MYTKFLSSCDLAYLSSGLFGESAEDYATPDFVCVHVCVNVCVHIYVNFINRQEKSHDVVEDNLTEMS